MSITKTILLGMAISLAFASVLSSGPDAAAVAVEDQLRGSWVVSEGSLQMFGSPPNSAGSGEQFLFISGDQVRIEGNKIAFGKDFKSFYTFLLDEERAASSRGVSEKRKLICLKGRNKIAIGIYELDGDVFKMSFQANLKITEGIKLSPECSPANLGYYFEFRRAMPFPE